MVKVNFEDKQLNDENESTEKRYKSLTMYESTICNECKERPSTHIKVTGLGCCPNYFEKVICNVCAKWYDGLTAYQWDDRGIVGVYELM